jgi:hypothetical protein
MNVDPSTLSIEICKVGNYVEGMGHILSADDFIWNGVYNFNWFKAKLANRKMMIEDHRLNPEENIDVFIDLMTINFNARMNRFFKLSTVKKVIQARFMKEYKVCPIFNDFSDTMYCNDMRLEKFC